MEQNPWQFRTFERLVDLEQFLASLPRAAQLEAEVLVDDEDYCVFYPVVASLTDGPNRCEPRPWALVGTASA